MLYQAYTGGRIAKFVYISKGNASKDPLREREETTKNAYPRKAVHYNYDNNSDANVNNEPECNDNSDNDSDASNDLR